ncbi:hypothetical protein ACFSQ3_09595 [Sphingobacterium corticis]|uniref:Uncharacterized protein n=1 Tax=Sphingobacterium corticis TaxID=1812823 RepID=A0ABW5NLD5_9SPHI
MWLREIGGNQEPLYEVEIVAFEPMNDQPYRIRYQVKGDPHFWLEDVEEFRLIHLPDALSKAILNQ